MRYILALLMLVLVACAQQQVTDPTATPTPSATASLTPTITNTPPPSPTSRPGALELSRAVDPSQQAYVSVVHAVPDLEAIDVYVERLAVATNLNYARSTLFSSLVASDYLLRVLPAGARYDDGPVLYETALSVSGGTTSLLLLTGTPQTISISTLPLYREPIERDSAQVSIVNAVNNSPEVTVMIGSTPVTAPLEFGSISLPLTLPADEATLSFSNGIQTLTSYTAILRERFAYTLVLVGDGTDAESVRAIELSERVPGQASLRFVNASPQLGPMDIYLDSQPAANNLEFTRSTEPQTILARSYTITVYESGSDINAVEPLRTQQIVFNEDDALNLLLVGPPQDLRILNYRENTAPTDPRNARVAFVNTLPEVNVTRIETQNGVLTDIGDLFYGQPPRDTELLAGTYRFVWIRVDGGETTEPVEIALDVQLEPGFSYLYLMTGRMADVPPVILSQRVGIDESLVNIAPGETPTATPISPTRVRFVNSIKGSLPLDVYVDSQLVFNALSYGHTTDLIPIAEGTHTVEFHQSGQLILMGRDLEFETSVPYTILAYGFGIEPIEVVQIDDSQVVAESASPTLRLINASVYGETSLGLGYALVDSASQETSLFSESPGGEMNRQSLAFGIERVPNIELIPGREHSEVGLAARSAVDIYVIDEALQMVAMIVRQANLSSNGHFDVIAYQNRDSLLIEGFAVRYPGS